MSVRFLIVLFVVLSPPCFSDTFFDDDGREHTHQITLSRIVAMQREINEIDMPAAPPNSPILHRINPGCMQRFFEVIPVLLRFIFDIIKAIK